MARTGEPVSWASLRPPFGLVEFERFAQRVVLLLFVSPAEASEPGVRTSSKSQVGAFSQPLPVRLAPGRQAIAGALARQICHGQKRSVRNGTESLPETAMDSDGK